MHNYKVVATKKVIYIIGGNHIVTYKSYGLYEVALEEMTFYFLIGTQCQWEFHERMESDKGNSVHGTNDGIPYDAKHWAAFPGPL